jgi:hypothetical protein
MERRPSASTLADVSALVWRDLMARLVTARWREPRKPRAGLGPGVRLVEGEFRYSDLWLDDDLDADPGASSDARGVGHEQGG